MVINNLFQAIGYGWVWIKSITQQKNGWFNLTSYPLLFLVDGNITMLFRQIIELSEGNFP
jgi:hypothetical protein